MTLLEQHQGPGRFARIAESLPGRSGQQVGEHVRNCSKGQVHTVWTDDEHEKVVKIWKRERCGKKKGLYTRIAMEMPNFKYEQVHYHLQRYLKQLAREGNE